MTTLYTAKPAARSVSYGQLSATQSELRVRDNFTRKCCKLPVHRITHHEPNRKGE